MSRSASFRRTLPLAALGVFAPLALLAAAALRASDGPEESVVPVPSTAPAAAVAAPGNQLRILVLRAGEAPYPWAVPGRIARSFVSSDPHTLDLVALAQVESHPELAEQIEWEIVPPAGFQLTSQSNLRGAKLMVQLTRPAGNPTGMGEPLSVGVRARVMVEGRSQSRRVVLTQDLRDRLRQEYVDLERAFIPSRQDLLDEAQFAQAFGKKYPQVTFAELNWSRQPGKEARYPVILAREELVRTLQEAETQYGRALIVSSGFRNPVRQAEVHGSVAESHHQYGRAADLYVVPDSSPPKTGRDYASEQDWLRLAAATMRGGGGWVEPMLACHVNTNGCHVHVDVRDAGTRTQVVQIQGKITDPTGLPVPGALVRLAGMPARTNEWGLFSLKHVLTPRKYDLTVEASGRGVRTLPINVGTSLTTLALRLPSDPNPALVARIADTKPGATGRLSVRVALRNAGRTSAHGLRLTAAPMDLPSRGGSIKPAHLTMVGVGQETEVEIDLPASDGGEGDTMPVVLSASYRTERGEERSQALRLAVPTTERASLGAPAETSRLPQSPTDERKAGPGASSVGAGGAGLAAGAAAAAAAALARRKRRSPSSEEPSVDPASILPPK